jgi:hypothetical protein
MNGWQVSNYDEAKAYLSKGRKTWDRPMYTRGLRLQSRPNNNIAINDKWGQFDPILFHPDGTITIQAPPHSGGWRPLWSQTVRRNIKDFSGLQNVFQRQSKVYITTSDALSTPVKVQKCRVCKGSGLVDSWCSPSYCNTSFPCEEHPEFKEPPKNSYGGAWHYGNCEHGFNSSHNIPKSGQCYNCKGNGKKDYGSKLISLEWDGSPLRLSNGALVRQPPTELEKRIAAYVKLDS